MLAMSLPVQDCQRVKRAQQANILPLAGSLRVRTAMQGSMAVQLGLRCPRVLAIARPGRTRRGERLRLRARPAPQELTAQVVALRQHVLAVARPGRTRRGARLRLLARPAVQELPTPILDRR